MALNVTMQVYRGTLANLSALATTGKAGVLAWTTDSNELFVDAGSGTAGIGAGKAWQRATPGTGYQTAVSSAAMIALSAQIGDLCDRTDTHQIFMLTAYPASTAGNWTALSPDASVTGIVGLGSGTSHQFVTYIDATGTQHLAQPAFADISGTATAAQIPAPTSTTIGGVKSAVAVAHNFVTAIGTDGSITQAQPAFTDVSGAITSTQLPASIGSGSNLTTIDCGSF